MKMLPGDGGVTGNIRRILELARRKVSDALVHGKALRIEGGDSDYVEASISV